MDLGYGQRIEFLTRAIFADDTLFPATFDGATTAKSRGGIFILTQFSDFAFFTHANHLDNMLFEMEMQWKVQVFAHLLFEVNGWLILDIEFIETYNLDGIDY